MMELVEGAIPVIQHLATAGADWELINQHLNTGASTAAVLPEPSTGDDRQTALVAADEQESADQAALVANLERTLERLRTGQASLLSGAILQQYQRQVVLEVQNSRPATRVLDVQG